jgi:tetratricopeptide (TPR) repeat protein
LKKSGLIVAVKSCHRLEKSQPEAYDFSPGQFADTGYILVELKRYRDAIKILKLGVEIHPEADTLRGSLAYAYLESGDKELARLNAQQCLILNPHNTKADVKKNARMKRGFIYR